MNVQSSTRDGFVICAGCGLDLTTTPKIRRRLGETSKGCSSDVRERVLGLWKELVCGIQQNLVILNDKLIMCRGCFNDFDKCAMKQTELINKLRVAFTKLDLSEQDEAEIAHTESPAPTRKRPSEDGHPAAQKQVVEHPLVLPSNESSSPFATLTVEHRSGVKRYNLLTPNRKHISKAAARGHKKAVADHCFKDDTIKEHAINKVASLIHDELKKMCSHNVNSILQRMSALTSFQWVDLMNELEVHAPTLMRILSSATKTRRNRPNRSGVIGMCAALLLKFRYSRMSLVQKLISTILYAGHSSKQVYERLQKLHLSMSHKSTTRLVTQLGKNHDHSVKEWRDSFLLDLASLRVPSYQEQGGDYGSSETSSSDYSSSEENNYSSEENNFSNEEDNISVDVSSSDSDFTSSTDDNEIANSVKHCPAGPLIVRPPQVLEPANIIKVLPGLPLQLRHKGFRLCGDNIDKRICRRHLRSDRRNQSVHYFHAYAVENRIDVSELSDISMHISETTTLENAVSSVLPTAGDNTRLRENIAILISRVLFQHLDFFNFSFDGVIQWHITHKYYTEMSCKSVVVPLGVILEDENTSDGMIEILTQLHQYVPQYTYHEEREISNGTVEKIVKANMRQILLGGDQLTAARSRSSIKAKMNSQTPSKQLLGIIPVVEDWHTKANFLGLIWKYFYSLNSASQYGTLFQLRNLTGRTNVKGKPIDSFDPCEDFFVVVIKAHIVAAAMKLLNMSSMGDVPSVNFAPQGDLTWTQTTEERKAIIEQITSAIVDSFVFLDYDDSSTNASSTNDGVYSYATNLLTLGCFYLEFRDAIKEGDGVRVLRCYRYMLPMFISSGRKNYAIETLNLLLQHDFLLSPRLAEELLWGRFINTRGQAGKNIPNDLHCEHLNRLCKGSIAQLGANKTESSMCRIARALGTIQPVLDTFDNNNEVTSTSTLHREANSEADFRSILETLLKQSVFAQNPGRRHSCFPNPRNPLHAKPYKDITNWIKEHTKCYFQK